MNAARTSHAEAGFTLIELLISMLVMMVVSAIVVGSTMDLMRLGATMTNRSDMHSGVRNATALLQQEVGQAGRVSLPAPASLATAAAVGPNTVGVTSATGMFVGERLTVDTGSSEETITLTAVNTAATPHTITADFKVPHNAGVRLASVGGFSAGVIPTTMMNGSNGNVLKIIGDINGDGNMVYIEYTCDIAGGRLFRNVMPIDAPMKPMLTVEQVLLDNLLPNPPNPDGTVPPCFIYQERTFGGRTYVIGVAIMTTVRTQQRDAFTRDFQTVTKALLNVSPRNVVNVWQLASLNYNERVQPVPPSVLPLLQ
jgi:type II secretory pathway pseudopilin PulG